MDNFLYFLEYGIDTEQLIIFIIAGICIWLLLREVKCWYWKINEITNEQKKQTRILEEMLYTMNPNSEYFKEKEKEKKNNYYLH